MPTTTPDNIFYADGSTVMSATAISAAEATSVQEALSTSRAIRSYKWVDQDAQDLQIDMQSGDEGYRLDSGVKYFYNGTQWRPQESSFTSYPATLTGFVVGTGGSAVASTEYRYEGELIRVRYRFTFGSTGQTFPSTPKFTLPVNSVALAHAYSFYNGTGDIFDTSATRPVQSWIIADNTSTSIVRISMRTSTGDGYDYPTTTTPWTWAAGDSMQGSFTYRYTL